jgi:hypothetical protein
MTSNETSSGIIFTLGCVALLVIVGFMSANIGKAEAQRHCETFGAFSHNGKLFECREKGKAQ